MMRINMLFHVRTTLEIDDAVFRQAKKLAAERGRTLGQLVSEALRESLRGGSPEDTAPFVMPVFGKPGGTVSRDPAFLASLRDDGR
jgi:hypothetical protein